MATLYVENVPGELYDALRDRARENHRSISAEVLSMLEQHVPTPDELARRRALLADLESLRAKASASPTGTSAEQMLRQDRDR